MSANDKICVLFGAGAEVNYGLSEGKNFAYDVLGIKNDAMNKAIDEYYSSCLEKCNHKEWYPNYHNLTFDKQALLKASIKRNLIEEKKFFKTEKEFYNEVDKQVRKFTTKPQGNVNSAGENFIHKHTSYMKVLDEKFHSIIYPAALGPYNFWGVVACYTRAYLSLLSKMCLKSPKKQSYINILKNPLSTYKKMEEFCKNPDLHTAPKNSIIIVTSIQE